MVITNDVTLITFVPFAFAGYPRGKPERLCPLPCGVRDDRCQPGPAWPPPSATPRTSISIPWRIWALPSLHGPCCPLRGISLVLLGGGSAVSKEGPVREFASQAPQGEKLPLPPLLAMLFCLALCLLAVFRVVGYLPVLVCVALVTLLVDRRLYGAVDYALLLTFLCFFIFVGNIKRLPEVNSLLQSLVGGRELWAGILASQVISNVPAAIPPFRLHRQLWRFAYSREPRRLGDAHRLAGQPDFLQILRPGVSRPNRGASSGSSQCGTFSFWQCSPALRSSLPNKARVLFPFFA